MVSVSIRKNIEPVLYWGSSFSKHMLLIVYPAIINTAWCLSQWTLISYPFLILLVKFLLPTVILWRLWFLNFAGFFEYDCSAVAEDANQAIQQKNGLSIEGRKITVKHAMHRAPLEQRRSKENQGWSWDFGSVKIHMLEDCWNFFSFLLSSMFSQFQ